MQKFYTFMVILAGLGVATCSVGYITNTYAKSKTEPIELWQTLCNGSELKSITITKTYQNGRAETNDYYCVK